jgi:hypothetical protein
MVLMDFVAGKLRLLEEDAPGASLTAMLQGLNRFLLQSIVNDFQREPPHKHDLNNVCLDIRFVDLSANTGRFLLLLQSPHIVV